MEHRPDSIRHASRGVRDRADGASDAVDDAHDKVSAPGIGPSNQTRDKADRLVQAAADGAVDLADYSGNRRAHVIPYGLNGRTDTVHQGRDRAFYAVP